MQKSAAQAAAICMVIVCSFLSKSTDQKLHLSGITKDLNRKHNKRKYAIACL
jgi:hypothetical protein